MFIQKHQIPEIKQILLIKIYLRNIENENEKKVKVAGAEAGWLGTFLPTGLLRGC